MQPYFLPYIGYWQLLRCVDCFVVYDQIQYTKKGWINRNRFLMNGHEELFTLPLRKAPDGKHVVEREIAPGFEPSQLLARWHSAYRRAPYFEETFELMKLVLFFPNRNLFAFLNHSIKIVSAHLGIGTPIIISSSLPEGTTAGKGSEKVLAICQFLGATQYINPIGGLDLYNKDEFERRGIVLHFLRSRPHQYNQLAEHFLPWLSVLDVLMFNSVRKVCDQMLADYDLI